MTGHQDRKTDASLLGCSLHKNIRCGCTGILLGRSERGQKGENHEGYGQIGRQDQACILRKAVTIYPSYVPDDGTIKKKSSWRCTGRDSLLAEKRLAERTHTLEN